jgi:hypothetical protein
MTIWVALKGLDDFINSEQTSVPTFLLGIGYDMGIYTQYPHPKYPKILSIWV